MFAIVNEIFVLISCRVIITSKLYIKMARNEYMIMTDVDCKSQRLAITFWCQFRAKKNSLLENFVYSLP